jgi:hypothetical protein
MMSPHEQDGAGCRRIPRPLLVKQRIPHPASRNPKPETRNPKPETRNPKPETRYPKTETRTLKAKIRNQKPETGNQELETSIQKPEIRNHESLTSRDLFFLRKTLHAIPFTLDLKHLEVFFDTHC